MADPLSTLIRSQRGPFLPALERLAPPPPDGLVAAEIESRSGPGDVVVELHGRGGWISKGAVDRLRRAYDVEATALTRLVSEVVLRPPDLRHLDAALTTLTNQPRGTSGLRDSINATFASRCATCGGPVLVEEFIWEADATAPSRRVYRCGHCRDPRSGEGRAVAVDRDDLVLAASFGGSLARDRLIGRFPVPDPEHRLPGQLLDLYTPRSLDAIAAILERIESDLRAPGIQAALRLALVHVLLPASRLNSYPGRVAQLRITAGRVRPPHSRQWRERDPWLLFEEGCRAVRAFVQRLDATGGNVQARFGADIAALLDGSANVVIRGGGSADGVRLTLPPADEGGIHGDPRSRVRLVLTQPPIHWSPENLGFAYLATSLILGADAAASLPVEALFGSQPRGEWAWDAAALRRGLAAVENVLAPEGRVVLLLDRAGPGGLVAGVLGGVGAGYRLFDALLAESGEEITGSLEFVLPEGPTPSDRGLRALPVADPGAPFELSAVSAAVCEIAVSVLQARGEPAHYERLLGEVLMGLDRMGHLRRLVGTRTFGETAARADASAAAVGLFGDVTSGLPGATAVEPPDPAIGARPDEPPPATAGIHPRGMDGSRPPPPWRSWRDPGRPVRGDGPLPAMDADAGNDAPPDAGLGAPPAIVTEVEVDALPTAQAVPMDGPPTTGDEDPGAPEGPGTEATWADRSSAADPVRLTLEIISGELRRPDHARLVELEPGRWWLRDPADMAAVRPPLADRIEWATFSLLSTSGGIGERAFYDRIAAMFRGHDTPDPELVRVCLESYRSHDVTAEGLLRTDDPLKARHGEHGELVGSLVEYGHRLGLRCWMSRREQRRPYGSGTLADLLSDVEARVYLPLICSGPTEVLEAVDCIWYLRGKATFLFEIEWTAMLGEPILRRGPRIPNADSLVRFLVIPPERTELVRLKLARSPLLRERFEADNWHVLKWDHVRQLATREEVSLADLEPFIGLDPDIERQQEQLSLF